MNGVDAPGLCGRRDRIHLGGNSGYQATGLARNWGAARVVLLGFDMQATGGRLHWHPDHPAALGNEGPYSKWVERFKTLAQDLRADGIEVINASRATALPWFDRKPLSEALQPPEQRAMPLVVKGMHGLGDNLHQRAVIRELMRSREVWLDTPWACLYHDLVGERLKLIGGQSHLRTQAKNAEREARRFERARPPRDTPVLSVSYPPARVVERGSVLAAMSAQCGVPVGDFRLPVPPEWKTKAAAVIQRATKPILIYRPLNERSEWSGCRSRNPDFGAYAALFRSIRERFYVVSIADLAPGKEWMVGEPVDADATYHAGELDVEALAALYQAAALVFTSPGFSVILAQAVGTAAVCVFGGYENSASFSAGARFAPYLGVDPIRPCQCFSHSHPCDKRIDLESAEQNLRAFVDVHCSKPTIDSPVSAAV